MASVSFWRSLSGRLVLLGVLPALAAIGIIVSWTAVKSYRQVQRSEEQVLAADATGAAAELSVRNARWNGTADIMARAQIAGMFGRRKETSDFVREVNSLSDLNLSAYVVYEPNADGKDAESLQSSEIPKEAMEATGRFVPVWYDDYRAGARTGETKLKNSVGMDTLPYYQMPKAEFARTGKLGAMLTEPYIKEGQLLISHVSPIVMQGRFAGIAGINRSLDLITRLAEDIKKRSRSDVFIVSPGGVFIAATTDTAGGEAELKGKSIEQTAFAKAAPDWQAGGMMSAFEARDPALGQDCLYARAVVADGGWRVIVRRPKSEVLAEASAALERNVLVGLAGMVLVGGLLSLVARRISGRVRLAAGAADRIAHGDLTSEVESSAVQDETGLLMRSMRQMDSNLNSLVGNVKQAGIRLNSTATEIAATSRQQESSTSTFGAASNQIAAAVKEISATSQDLVKTVDTVNRNAQATAELAGTGRAGLQGMESVMGDLDRGTRSIADKLGAISERSQKITTIITTIAKVADQTNILSINAAIEAEKAGEVGAGFLVIAREIRRLADQTASATLDIEQMVQQMQSAVSSGVMEMDRFADQVRRGVRDVGTAGSQLTEIINRVNSSTESFRQVSESVQAQSEGARQISDAMGSLVANATQTAQSAQEFGRAAADLQSAIGMLREAVSKFKLRE